MENTANDKLFAGAKSGNLGLITEALSNGADIGANDSKGLTALHIAAIYGKTEAVKLLLERNAEANIKNEHGKTPLHAAACNGYDKTAIVLLDNGADVNAQDTNDDTPLHDATKAYIPHTNVINLLIAKGADIKIGDSQGKIPLNYYFEKFMELGTAERFSVKILLSLGVGSAEIKAKDKYGHTLLHKTAFHKDNQEDIRLLLDNGANVNAIDNEEMTPLHHAANKGNADAIEMLLDRGANINARKKWGNTPLDLTVIEGKFEAMECLLKRGADVGPNKENDSHTPLHYAVTKGDTKVIESLIKHSADVNAKNNSDVTPIRLAVDKKNINVIKLLAKNGAEINDDIRTQANKIRSNLGEELLELYNNFKYLPKTTLSSATIENMAVETVQENCL